MPNAYFQFKQFIVHQDRCAMKVTTDACLFGAWVANEDKSQEVEVKRVLDIGAGTGLLSLMYAQKYPLSHIDAIEIDESAYIQARENITASPFAKKITIIHDDVKMFTPSKKYDSIVSNPPFYEKEVRSNDPRKNVAHHHSGLLFEELLGIIKAHLPPSGIFYMLLPFKRNDEIKKILLKQDLLVSKIVFVKQSPKHSYFRLMISGTLQKDRQETLIDEISILDDQQQYTEEFKELLSDYYLYL